MRQVNLTRYLLPEAVKGKKVKEDLNYFYNRALNDLKKAINNNISFISDKNFDFNNKNIINLYDDDVFNYAKDYPDIIYYFVFISSLKNNCFASYYYNFFIAKNSKLLTDTQVRFFNSIVTYLVKSNKDKTFLSNSLINELVKLNNFIPVIDFVMSTNDISLLPVIEYIFAEKIPLYAKIYLLESLKKNENKEGFIYKNIEINLRYYNLRDRSKEYLYYDNVLLEDIILFSDSLFFNSLKTQFIDKIKNPETKLQVYQYSIAFYYLLMFKKGTLSIPNYIDAIAHVYNEFDDKNNKLKEFMGVSRENVLTDQLKTLISFIEMRDEKIGGI